MICIYELKIGFSHRASRERHEPGNARNSAGTSGKNHGGNPHGE
jgi:hypothetical protein